MKRIITCLVAALSVIGSASTSAGGLWLNEFGSPAMGRARAGAEAGVDDASTVLHNPATITRLDKEQWMAAGGLIISKVKMENNHLPMFRSVHIV